MRSCSQIKIKYKYLIINVLCFSGVFQIYKFDEHEHFLQYLYSTLILFCPTLLELGF